MSALIIIKNIWSFVNSKFFLAILSIFLTAAVGFVLDLAKKNKADAVRWENNYNVKVVKNDSLRDANGTLVVRTQTLEFTIDEIKNSTDSLVINLLTQLEASGIKVKQLETALVNTETFKQNLQSEILNLEKAIDYYKNFKPDSLKTKPGKVLVFEENSPWVKEKLYLTENMTWDRDLEIYNQSFFVLYWSRPGNNFFQKTWSWVKGKKDYYGEMKSLNPYIKNEPAIIQTVKRGKR